MGVILFDMDGVIVNSEVAYMEQLKNFRECKIFRVS